MSRVWFVVLALSIGLVLLYLPGSPAALRWPEEPDIAHEDKKESPAP